MVVGVSEVDAGADVVTAEAMPVWSAAVPDGAVVEAPCSVAAAEEAAPAVGTGLGAGAKVVVTDGTVVVVTDGTVVVVAVEGVVKVLIVPGYATVAPEPLSV